MKNIYFDLCSIPFFLLILWTCHSRKLTQGRANKLFVLMAWMSLVCASVDILMEYFVNPVPLSQARVFLGYLCSYSYKTIRNASLVIYILYILAVTRTEYRIRPLRMRLLLWLPDGILIALLIQNLFTHNVFVITSTGGYARGPLLSIFYIIAMIYGIAGATYCIYVIRHALRCSNRHFICGEKRDLPGRMTSVVKLDAARSSHSVHERRAAVKAALQMF